MMMKSCCCCFGFCFERIPQWKYSANLEMKCRKHSLVTHHTNNDNNVLLLLIFCVLMFQLNMYNKLQACMVELKLKLKNYLGIFDKKKYWYAPLYFYLPFTCSVVVLLFFFFPFFSFKQKGAVFITRK